MKKIALVTPGIMPVPAIYGGAVEVLIQCFIDDNEIEKLADIDLYSVYDSKIDSKKYSNCKIIPVRQNCLSKFCYGVINKIFRIFGLKNLNYFNKHVAKEIKKREYDWIIVENSPHLFRYICENTQNSDRMIFHLHNNIDQNRTRDALEYVVQHSKLVITVSEYLKNHLNINVPNDKTEVLYNCVDVNRFSFNEEIRKQYRVKNNLSDTDIVFLYSGRINSDKGVKELIIAFKEVAKTMNNVKLLIVGNTWFGKVKNDTYTQNIQKIAEEISDKIIFTGYLLPDEMPQVYNAADVVVIPSLWDEPFGVVGLEAMSMGKAIIATKSGGLTEFLDDSCAFMVNRDKYNDEMTAGMYKLASDKQLRVWYGKKAHEKLKSHPEFLHENYLKGLINIIDKL